MAAKWLMTGMDDRSLLDTWDPGCGYTFTNADGFHVVAGDPDPIPAQPVPRQHRERFVYCRHPGCDKSTWRHDAFCHAHALEHSS